MPPLATSQTTSTPRCSPRDLSESPQTSSLRRPSMSIEESSALHVPRRSPSPPPTHPINHPPSPQSLRPDYPDPQTLPHPPAPWAHPPGESQTPYLPPSPLPLPHPSCHSSSARPSPSPPPQTSC